MVGSLKKGSKQSMSLPSTAYNTLPSHMHGGGGGHLRTSSSSPRVVNPGTPGTGVGVAHKRSPSSDSGHGTLHNPLAAVAAAQAHRSNTPVSYGGGGGANSNKVHHTVYLHGENFGMVLGDAYKDYRS